MQFNCNIQKRNWIFPPGMGAPLLPNPLCIQEMGRDEPWYSSLLLFFRKIFFSFLSFFPFFSAHSPFPQFLWPVNWPLLNEDIDEEEEEEVKDEEEREEEKEEWGWELGEREW